MRSLHLIVWFLGVSLIGTATLALEAEPPQQRQDAIPETEDAPPGGDFTLQSKYGPVSLKDFRGKVVFLYFGYTKCPDICPTSLAFITETLSDLSDEELEKVKSIFVSVDPKRDTPEDLAEYVEYFHPNFVGVTGSEKEIAEMSKLYGAQYYEVELEGSAFGYSVNHSAAVYLIQPDGGLRFIFPHATPSSVMLEAVRYLLAGN